MIETISVAGVENVRMFWPATERDAGRRALRFYGSALLGVFGDLDQLGLSGDLLSKRRAEDALLCPLNRVAALTLEATGDLGPVDLKAPFVTATPKSGNRVEHPRHRPPRGSCIRRLIASEPALTRC